MNKMKSLYERDTLLPLDEDFIVSLDENLRQRLRSAREMSVFSSALVIDLAPSFEAFIGRYFNITTEIVALQKTYRDLEMISHIKRVFVQRIALKKYAHISASPHAFSFTTEYAYAQKVQEWLQDPEKHAEELDQAAQYAAWASLSPMGKEHHRGGTLFSHPHKMNPDELMPSLEEIIPRDRDGFSLTDPGLSRLEALGQAHYCIHCHHQGKDSCSSGLKPKIGSQSSEKFQKNTFGTSLTGCPLEQKISEMNELKTKGFLIAALAVICIDNPMVAATGHRICNDCMKACIYQKQDPVNIPGIETHILREVLALPWGVEIYSLLTRWNPLNVHRPLPLPASGYHVLVAGCGPAGFTLAHHLVNDGHQATLIDGLKIEPLPSSVKDHPVADISLIQESLDDRIAGGFGGVTEYGITVRWDKNFLTLIRLLLERRQEISIYGGVRLGGTLTIQQALAMGFDHVALCLGAGSPTLLSLKNRLAPGVRQASDFLMALQLTGAARKKSNALLQMRLPVLVIGGGLTAIDTATEAMAYYPRQVEKFYRQYQDKPQEQKAFGDPLFEEFYRHGEAIVAERTRATQEGRLPCFHRLVKEWGGVHLLYRKKWTDSPAYKLNHEEVIKALEEGIVIQEEVNPLEIIIDEKGHCLGLRTQHGKKETTFHARSIFVAAGTKPNIQMYEEDPWGLSLNGAYFQAATEDGHPINPEKGSKPDTPDILLYSHNPEASGRISFFGDLHPSYSGNVVKAMASAKQGYPVITRSLQQHAPKNRLSVSDLRKGLRASVHAVNRLTPSILEIIVHAPFAAQAFQPGQFYRFQNFERLVGTENATEGIALTGACVQKENGLVSLIVLEMGVSTRLCATLKAGDPVVLMGPTGAPTEIPENETVLLIGGGLGNAVLFSIGQAMRAKGCFVIYYAGYKSLQDRYKVEELEAAADELIWCCDEAPGFPPNRPQDKTFVGNLVAALDTIPPSKSIDRLLVIGSDGLMAAIAQSCRHRFTEKVIQLGSINSPMQCMMKGICANCLQRHVDPISGEERVVFSCAHQDQNLQSVDFQCLKNRLNQNALLEKMANHSILQ